MEIHLYALCWNEEKMLHFFFNHYDKIVDEYYIFDNNSSDNSLQILHSNPKVNVGTFNVKKDSFLKEATYFYNHKWKQSRRNKNCAWVIICNIDEFLHHSNLVTYLRKCKQRGITILEPIGYDMVSPEFPPRS